jgi:single-stranded-DNA-specific exonuclease
VEAMNQERRQVESASLEYVFAECDRLAGQGTQGFVVLGSFHPGVIGIIASRVAERYQRPVFILTEDSSEPSRLKGSGRSVDGVNLYEVLQECAETLIQFGGHRMAAGLTMTKENLAAFTGRFNEVAGRELTKRQDVRQFVVDFCPRPDEILNEKFLAQYQNLEPFGNGNPEPVFLLERTRVHSPGTVKNHLKYNLEVNGQTYRAIGFGLADKAEILSGDEPVHLAVKIKNSVFRGVKRTELHTVDVFPLGGISGQE